MACDYRHEALLAAIQKRRLEDVKQLFSSGKFSVNEEIPYIFEDGKKEIITPLFWASRYNRPSICSYLLRSGADPYKHMVFDLYPLHEACDKGYSEVVEAFVGGSGRGTAGNGSSASRARGRHGHLCDVNGVTKDLDTPLHVACSRGHIQCAHILLSANADTSMRNLAGRNPLETAVHHGHNDLARLFKAHGHEQPKTISYSRSEPPSPNLVSNKKQTSPVVVRRRKSLTGSASMQNSASRPRPLSTLVVGNIPHSIPNRNSLHLDESVSILVPNSSEWTSSRVENSKGQSYLRPPIVLDGGGGSTTSKPSSPLCLKQTEHSNDADGSRKNKSPALLFSSQRKSPKARYSIHTEKPLCESLSYPQLIVKSDKLVERTRSSDELFASRKASQPQHPSALSLSTRTSATDAKDMFESLSKHLWDSLEAVSSALPPRFENPLLVAMQKALGEMPSTYNISVAQYRSLYATRTSHQPVAVSSSVKGLEDGGGSSYRTILSDFEYEIVGEALKTEADSPVDGCASVHFLSKWAGITAKNKWIRDSGTGLLKVMVKVKKIVQREDTSGQNWQEAHILQLLPPHPTVTGLLYHSTESVDSRNLRKVMKALAKSSLGCNPDGGKAELIFFSIDQTAKTLAEYFAATGRNNIREKDVLVILAQLLLAVTHLQKFNVVHFAVCAENVFVDNDLTLVLGNFEQAVDFSADHEEVKVSVLRIVRTGKCSEAFAPELSRFTFDEAMPDFEAFCQHDTYSSAKMVYQLLLIDLSKSLELVQYTNEDIPDIASLSGQCNTVLKKLVACSPVDRLSAIKGAMCCFVLLFGPSPSQVKSVEDCHRWIVAESMELFLKPVLKSDTECSKALDRLHFMYLTVGNPELIWDSCKLLRSCCRS